MSQETERALGFSETQKALQDKPPESEGDIAALQFTNEAAHVLSDAMTLGLSENGYYDGAAARSSAGPQ